MAFQRFRPTFRKLFLKKNFFDSFNGWLYRQKRDLADKSQKAKKASGVNPTQKRRTTPLLSGASGFGTLYDCKIPFDSKTPESFVI